jgi:signal transduction histidine kinase
LKQEQLKKEHELKTALAKIEIQNRLQEQRLRISRDLHDNIGAQLTFIISSIDNLKFALKDDIINKKLSKISGFTTETIYQLRDTIWAMNKNDITFEDLQTRISNFIDNAKISSENTKFKFTIPSEIGATHTFTSIQGMNMYRIIQESINNASKYAEASNINVSIQQDESKFLIKIEDDGKGFDPKKVQMGNGINNIQKRARDLGSHATISSEIGKGTSVSFTVDR